MMNNLENWQHPSSERTVVSLAQRRYRKEAQRIDEQSFRHGEGVLNRTPSVLDTGARFNLRLVLPHETSESLYATTYNDGSDPDQAS